MSMHTRRSQTTRHYARPSLLPTDDLGVLRESDESTEDVLRRQVLERERDIDKVRFLKIPPHPSVLTCANDNS